MKNSQDYLNLLRKIKNKPKSSQRELADELGFSLRKLNYILNLEFFINRAGYIFSNEQAIDSRAKLNVLRYRV